jgi:hypothetical protein
MSDRHADTDAGQAPLGEPTVRGTGTVEAYAVDDGVVLHDAEDPLAWVEAERALDLREHA